MGINDINYSETKRLAELTQQTSNLDSIVKNSGSQDARKAELKKLFTQSYFNDSSQKANIEAQIKALQEKIDLYEGKVEALQKEIEGKQEEITKISNQIVDQVDKIARKTGEFERTSKEEIQDAMDLAIYHFRTDSHSKRNGGEKTMLDFINEQMLGVMSGIYSDQGVLKSMIGELAVPQNKVKTFAQELEDKIGDVDLLEGQYTTAKATLELLKLTNSSVAESAKSYQVSENSSAVPIFTPAKAELANDYLAQYTSRLAGKETQTPTATTMSKEDITEKYGAMVKPQTSGVDPYSSSNAQLMSFGEALDAGLVADMQAAGFTQKEMLDTIHELFPSIGVYHNSNGTASIPWGHAGAGESGVATKERQSYKIYTKFAEQFNASSTAPVKGDGDQLKEMKNAINKDGIIGEMKSEDFTWKECAYTITRLWPNSGIEYQLGKNEINIPNDDGNSGGVYDALAKQIQKNYPDVKINRGNTAADPKPQEEVKRTDPVGFSVGDSSFEFAVDRDGDNVINDFTEMVGANGVDGMEELKSFDADGNGKLEGDELDNLLVFNIDHAQTTSDKTDIEFISASQLGIESIDLNSFEEAALVGEDGREKDFVDINNSLITGNFDVKLNTSTFEDVTGLDASRNVTGYQKYVTEDYMKAVYNPLMGNNIEIDLNDAKVNKILDDAFDPSKNGMEDINELKKLLHQQWLLKGDLKTALDNKVDNIVNELIGFKTSKTSEAIGLSLTADKEFDTIYTNEEADTVTANHLDNAEDEAYGKKIKEELIKDGIINPLYQDEI